MGRLQRRLGLTIDRVAEVVSPIVPAGSPLRPRLRALRAWLPTDPVLTDPINRIISEFARRVHPVFFIQVGANDGRQRDPFRRHIYQRRWSGIAVEPVPYVFERLQETHRGNQRVILEMAALAAQDGTRTLYYLPEAAEADLPQWYDALASFRKEVLLRHAAHVPDIETRVATMQVRCLTFDSLCEKHGVETVDLIGIDTEGYDYEILKSIDLDRYRPMLLLYEHLHLDDDTRAAAAEHMGNHGYETISDWIDTVCLRRVGVQEDSRRLLSLWDQLRVAST